jgi:N-glycosidase YbiA
VGLKITSFRGEYRFLSNFWPCNFWFRGYEWASAEHAYQAMKCQDVKYQMAFLYPRVSAADAKRMGSEAKIDDSFAANKLNYMRAIVSAKFDQNPELMTLLKSTARAELVEGNTWGDTFWGVCNGKGHNHLGKILMNIRDDITRLI